MATLRLTSTPKEKRPRRKVSGSGSTTMLPSASMLSQSSEEAPRPSFSPTLPANALRSAAKEEYQSPHAHGIEQPAAQAQHQCCQRACCSSCPRRSASTQFHFWKPKLVRHVIAVVPGFVFRLIGSPPSSLPRRRASRRRRMAVSAFCLAASLGRWEQRPLHTLHHGSR